MALLVFLGTHIVAVKAAIGGKQVPGQVRSFYAHIRLAVDQARAESLRNGQRECQDSSFAIAESSLSFGGC
jgi:hypothetical protein